MDNDDIVQLIKDKYIIYPNKVLYNGAIAVVVKGRCVKTNIEIIAKITKTDILHENKLYLEKVIHEVHNLKYIKDNELKHTIKYLDSYLFPKYHILIYEYVEGTDFHEYVNDYIGSIGYGEVYGLPEADVKMIFRKILVSVKELHDIHIAHLDIKLENVIYNEATGDITLIDLGYSKITERNGEHTLLEDRCGSVNYVAPEIVNQLKYIGEKADMWSCGVLLYVLAFCKFPFEGKDDDRTLGKVIRGRYTVPEYASDDLKDILKKMLHKIPGARWDAERLLEHRFLK